MDELVQSTLRISVARLCLGHGWHAADGDCLYALSDVLHLYLARLCHSVAQLAELRRLQSPQLADFLRALSEAGLDEPDAREYLAACGKLAPFPRAFSACPVHRADELNWPSEAELNAELVAGDRPEHLSEHLPLRRRKEADDLAAGTNDASAVEEVDDIEAAGGTLSSSIVSSSFDGATALSASALKQQQQQQQLLRDCYGNRVGPSRFAMRLVAMASDGRVVPLTSRQAGVAPSSRPPPETFRSRPRPHPDRRRTAETLGHDWLNSGSDSEPEFNGGGGAGLRRGAEAANESIGFGGDSMDVPTTASATAGGAAGTAAAQSAGIGGSDFSGNDSNEDSSDQPVVISRRDLSSLAAVDEGSLQGRPSATSAATAASGNATAATAQSRFADNLDEILDNLPEELDDSILKKSTALATAAEATLLASNETAMSATPAVRKVSAGRGKRKSTFSKAAASAAAAAMTKTTTASASALAVLEKPSFPAASPESVLPLAAVTPAAATGAAQMSNSDIVALSPSDPFAFNNVDAMDSVFPVASRDTESVGGGGGNTPDSTDTLPAVGPDDGSHRHTPTSPPLTPSAPVSIATIAASPPLRMKLKLPTTAPPPPAQQPLGLFDTLDEYDDDVELPEDFEQPESELVEDVVQKSSSKRVSREGKRRRHHSPSKVSVAALEATALTAAPAPPIAAAVPKLTIRLGSAPVTVESLSPPSAPAQQPPPISPPLPQPPPPPPVTQSIKLKISIGGVRVLDQSSAASADDSRSHVVVVKSPPPPLSPAMPVLSAMDSPRSFADPESAFKFDNFQDHCQEVKRPTGGAASGRSRAGRSRPRGPAGRHSAVQAGRQSSAASLPTSVTVVQHEASYYFDADGNQIWLCPACSEEDDGSLMIGCSRCEDWYHAICLGFVEPPPEDEDWLCPKCRGHPVRRVANRAELMARADAGLPLAPAPAASLTPSAASASYRPPPNKKRRR